MKKNSKKCLELYKTEVLPAYSRLVEVTEKHIRRTSFEPPSDARVKRWSPTKPWITHSKHSEALAASKGHGHILYTLFAADMCRRLGFRKWYHGTGNKKGWLFDPANSYYGLTAQKSLSKWIKVNPDFFNVKMAKAWKCPELSLAEKNMVWSAIWGKLSHVTGEEPQVAAPEPEAAPVEPEEEEAEVVIDEPVIVPGTRKTKPLPPELQPFQPRRK